MDISPLRCQIQRRFLKGVWLIDRCSAPECCFERGDISLNYSSMQRRYPCFSVPCRFAFESFESFESLDCFLEMALTTIANRRRGALMRHRANARQRRT